MSTIEAERKALFKQGLDLQSTRRRRQETTQQIRKNKKEENLMKRRQGAVNNNADAAMSANTELALPLKNKPTIADIPDFMKVITNTASKNEELIEAVRGIRRMLSVETNPPVNEVLATGILPYLVNFLQKHDSWVLMFESSWTLTNIASTQRTKDVVDGGAVPFLIALLSHEKADLREQAIWCLGNIAGDCTDFRDYLIQQGIMGPLLLNLKQPDNISLLNNVVWVISNLCRGKPGPNRAIVEPIIRPLADLLDMEVPVEIKVDAVWALAYISDGNNERIQMVMDTNVTSKLVEFLAVPSSSLLTPTVRCLGNFVSGSDHQTQAVLSAGLLQHVNALLENPRNAIRKEACWLASNVAAGTTQQIEELFSQSGLVQKLVQTTMDAPWNIRKEATWALANICTTGTDFQVERLVEKNEGLRALVEILSSSQSDAKVLAVVLDAISRVLEIGKAYDKAYDLKLDEYEGIDKIEGLQEHPNDEVYDKAVKIIELYFSDEQGGDENLAPATTTSNTFAFGVTSKQLFPPGGSPVYNFSMVEPRSPAHPIMFDSSPGRGTFMSE